MRGQNNERGENKDEDKDEDEDEEEERRGEARREETLRAELDGLDAAADAAQTGEDGDEAAT